MVSQHYLRGKHYWAIQFTGFFRWKWIKQITDYLPLSKCKIFVQLNFWLWQISIYIRQFMGGINLFEGLNGSVNKKWILSDSSWNFKPSIDLKSLWLIYKEKDGKIFSWINYAQSKNTAQCWCFRVAVKIFSWIILDQVKDTQTRFGILINAVSSVFFPRDNPNQDIFSFLILF